MATTFNIVFVSLEVCWPRRLPLWWTLYIASSASFWSSAASWSLSRGASMLGSRWLFIPTSVWCSSRTIPSSIIPTSYSKVRNCITSGTKIEESQLKKILWRAFGSTVHIVGKYVYLLCVRKCSSQIKSVICKGLHIHQLKCPRKESNRYPQTDHKSLLICKIKIYYLALSLYAYLSLFSGIDFWNFLLAAMRGSYK